MWILPALLLTAVVSYLIVFQASRSDAVRTSGEPWILNDTAKMHVSIMGTLAGFAFTGVVLIVTITRGQSGAASALDTVIVMFLIAYLWWVGNAFLLTFMPHGDKSGQLVSRVHFSLATTLEYRTIFLSWFALLPLLEANGLGRIAYFLYVFLPTSLVFGSALVSMVTDGLGFIRVKRLYLSATIVLASALAYAAFVTYSYPEARTPYSTLCVAIAIFFINGVSFTLATLTPLAKQYSQANRFYARYGKQIVFADMQLTLTALVFLWLAVVGVI